MSAMAAKWPMASSANGGNIRHHLAKAVANGGYNLWRKASAAAISSSAKA
jgi:hypothetical protein